MSTPLTELRSDALASAARTVPADRPVFMVNLLRYREQADYGSGTDLPPCPGREAYYGRYAPAFNRVAAALGVEGIKPVWIGHVLANLLVSSGERWDDVVVVEYPTMAALRRVLESPEYHAQASPHRQAAVADWRFFATVQMALPN